MAAPKKQIPIIPNCVLLYRLGGMSEVRFYRRLEIRHKLLADILNQFEQFLYFWNILLL